MTKVYVGVDAGTSSVKVAAFDGRGAVVAASRRPMPELELRGDAAVQALEPCVEAVVGALGDLSIRYQEWEFVALTTQRDTAILSAVDGRPLTPLISWRDRRASRRGTVWAALVAEDPSLAAGAHGVRSLVSELSYRWTGRVAETLATLTRHQSDAACAELDAECGRRIARPDTVEIGAPAGRMEGGAPLHLTAGDKNCELLGNGVLEPGLAGLSLGSAVSLGATVRGDRPATMPGVVVTPAAFVGAWNVETGLIVGMQGENIWDDWLSGERTIGPDLLPGLWCLPFFAGALDDPGMPAALIGLAESHTSRDLYQAWAQGVVGELRRLRPMLESAGGQAVRRIVVSGGGAAAPAWSRLIADALRVSVVRRDDPWRGARGAVLSVLLARNPMAAAAFTSADDPSADQVTEPDPDTAARAEGYYATQDLLVRSIGDVFIARRLPPSVIQQ